MTLAILQEHLVAERMARTVRSIFFELVHVQDDAGERIVETDSQGDFRGVSLVEHRAVAEPGQWINQGLVFQQVNQVAGAQGRAHAGEQFRGFEGFGDVIDRAQFQAAHFFFGRRDRGEKNHRCAGGDAVGLQAFAGFEAAHARHVHVKKDQIRPNGCGQDQSISGVGRGMNVDRFIGKQRFDERMNRFGIVNDQQLLWHAFPQTPKKKTKLYAGSQFIGRCMSHQKQSQIIVPVFLRLYFCVKTSAGGISEPGHFNGKLPHFISTCGAVAFVIEP